MSSIIESKAAFGQRCDELVSDGSLRAALAAQGIERFKDLAFAAGTPQAPPTDQAFRELVSNFHGAGATLGQTATLRHLHFESTTLVIQTYKELVSHDSGEGINVRRMPAAEKRARLESQQSRLAGISISGELEPSFQLLDAANQIYETGVMLWLPPSKCSKRESEIAAGLKDKASTIQVENNVVKVGPANIHVETDVSDSLRVQWAFMRRGLAFDSCKLFTWATHQAWVQKLLDCLSTVPPPGFSQISVSQVIRADKELFVMMAREAKPPFKATAAGVSPLDAEMKRLMNDPRILQFLLPMPRQVANAFKSDAADSSHAGEEEVTRPKPKPKPNPKAKAAAKFKQPRNVPAPLKGLKTRAEKGNVCWDYNLECGCQGDVKRVDGIDRCPKGLHICAGCHKQGHSYVNCRSKKE